MAYTWQAVDEIEPISDSNIEGIANIATYNIVSGCDPSYSLTDMVVTIGAGMVTHNGSIVLVASDTVTVVSDPSNPRWTWVAIDSSGGAVLVSGDPAAIPSVPELGDNVGVVLLLVQTAQTIVDSITYKIDKRVFYPSNTDFLDVQKAFRANRRLVAEYSAQSSATDGTSGPAGIGFWQLVSNAADDVVALSGEPYLRIGNGPSGLNGVRSSGSNGGLLAVVSPDHSPRYLCRLLLPAASANVTYWLAGFFASNSATSDGAYLRIVTTGNVRFVTRQGGTETATDLGVLSRVAILGFEIETQDDGVTWVCRNQAGTVLATHTDDVPTAGTALAYGNVYQWASSTIPAGVAYQRVEGTFA